MIRIGNIECMQHATSHGWSLTFIRNVLWHSFLICTVLILTCDRVRSSEPLLMFLTHVYSIFTHVCDKTCRFPRRKLCPPLQGGLCRLHCSDWLSRLRNKMSSSCENICANLCDTDLITSDQTVWNSRDYICTPRKIVSKNRNRTSEIWILLRSCSRTEAGQAKRLSRQQRIWSGLDTKFAKKKRQIM